MTRVFKRVIMFFLGVTSRDQSSRASELTEERAGMQRDVDDTQTRLDYVRYEARMLSRALREPHDGSARRPD